MKTKEVCQRTGLTRKTLLLYEAKGLYHPKKVYSGGREYREYTEENVRELRDIATLRRAWFTMEEIRQMQEEPETVGDIFERYYAWLLAQREELEALLRAAEDLRRSGDVSRERLVERLSRPAEQMPLPPSDIHPHFRYLDEMEERPPCVQAQTNFAEDGGNAGFWQLSMERRGGIRPVSYDDIFRGMGFADYKIERENGTVASRIDRDPKWLRIVKGFFMGLFGVSLFMLILNWFCSPEMQLKFGFYWFGVWGGLCIGGGLIRGGLEFITWRKQHRSWQRQDREKPRPDIRG